MHTAKIYMPKNRLLIQNPTLSILTWKNQILLATARVLVNDVFGEYTISRFLLDSFSAVNFITENFV